MANTSTDTIKKFRIGTDATARISLTDGGVTVAWTTVDEVKAMMYSEAQEQIVAPGRCTIDADDPTKLIVTFDAGKQLFSGKYKIILEVRYKDTDASYDVEAFEIVSNSDEAGTTVQPVNLAITVESVTTTVLQGIIEEAIEATTAANTATTAANAAEKTRSGAEKIRVLNEEARKSAETARANAETTRQTNESARQREETTRQQNETARQATINALGTQVTTKKVMIKANEDDSECVTLTSNYTADDENILQISGSNGEAIVRGVADPKQSSDAVNLALLDDRYSYLGLRKKGTSKKLADLAVGDWIFVYGYDKNVPPQSTTKLTLIKAVMAWGDMNLSSAKSWVENIPNSGTLVVVKANHDYDDKLEDCISYAINGQSTDSFFKCTIPFRSPNIETDEANIAELQRKDRIFVANVEDDINDGVTAHNKYSEIIIILDDGEDIDAKIFPVSQGGGAWMYEWQEQYRIINDDIEDFEGDTWDEFLSWADSHSTAILSEAEATARYTKILTYNSTQYTADEVTIANNKVVNLGANVEIVHIPFASGMNWNILRVSGGSAERTLRVWYGDMDAEVTIPKYKSVDLLVHTFDETTLLVHPLYSDTFQYDTTIGTSSNAPTSSAVKTYVDGLVGNINTILTRIVG